MKSINKQTHDLLIKKKITISTCESCTAGLLASSLTEFGGSSNYFKMGLIAYSNEIKINILKINRNIITNYGAVSKQTVLAMAKTIRKMAKTNLGLAITGIAGPTGATAIKPVGLVYIAIASARKTRCEKFNFKGKRGHIRQQAAQAALRLIKKWIQ